MSARNHVLIAPQIFVPLDDAGDSQETEPRRAEIPMTWAHDDSGFRLDIELPESCALDLVFPMALASLHVNGETIWADGEGHPARHPGVQVESTALGLRLTCTASGRLHVLALGAASDA